MNGDHLCFEPAYSLHERIVKKDLPAREVEDAFLDRIELVNPKVNAYTHIDAEGARRQADEADRALVMSGPLGPLHGIPVCIKDLDAVAGMPQTMGCKLFADLVAQEDAVYVKRLRQAGAVILGNTNTPEFGFRGTTDNPLFGATRNPWRLDRTRGGSSRPRRRGLNKGPPSWVARLQLVLMKGLTARSPSRSTDGSIRSGPQSTVSRLLSRLPLKGPPSKRFCTQPVAFRFAYRFSRNQTRVSSKPAFDMRHWACYKYDKNMADFLVSFPIQTRRACSTAKSSST